MYNEQNFTSAKKVVYGIVAATIVGVVIVFMIIICGRLDNSGAVIKDESLCATISPAAAKQIAPEWLELNCPQLLPHDELEEPELEQ